MSIPSDIIRGHTDAIILALLQQGDSYGYRINRDISEKTDHKYELKEATLYTAFRRLEKEGMTRSFWGDEELGARRRYYSITTKGRTTLEVYRREWEEAKSMIDALICSKEDSQ